MTCALEASPPSGNAVVMTTANGGGSWATHALPADIFDLGPLTCHAAGDCEAVGDTESGADLEISHNSGVTWSGVGVPDVLAENPELSCSSATDCAVASLTITGPINEPVLESVVGTTTDAGAKWAVTVLQRSLGLTLRGLPISVSCASSLICEVLDLAGLAWGTGDGGRTWRQQALPATFEGETIDCATTSSCVAAGTELLATTTSGLSWSPEPIPAATAFVGSLSCASATACGGEAEGTDGLELLATG